MKKLVPDPPPILCVGPGLSHEDAIQRATEHLVKAIQYAACLPDLPMTATRNCSVTRC
ncbi:hypothetical protein N7650_05940 [Pseudomonas sp. GD04058]|uniref:hypothetical protein n=1 Tax=Pseudomonas sp. GD04058 TaxID=2975429 RepID=UPI0024486E2F|nr:hypothetical protein [Pseudomonas sp. GD04058]MDG9882370.1 hypothetical protein [Pseudomonas sp. GD04058]